MNDKELMNAINKIQTEVDDVKKALEANSEPTFSRVTNGTKYYSAVLINTECGITICVENGDGCDTNRFKYNNYFYTRERAQEVADKINFLLKLERLHDVYCPDYNPNWNADRYATDRYKYYVYYNYTMSEWYYKATERYSPTFVYFPTEEIAQKVCDILNA